MLAFAAREMGHVALHVLGKGSDTGPQSSFVERMKHKTDISHPGWPSCFSISLPENPTLIWFLPLHIKLSCFSLSYRYLSYAPFQPQLHLLTCLAIAHGTAHLRHCSISLGALLHALMSLHVLPWLLLFWFCCWFGRGNFIIFICCASDQTQSLGH